jgi:hypothetical protein
MPISGISTRYWQTSESQEPIEAIQAGRGDSPALTTRPISSAVPTATTLAHSSEELSVRSLTHPLQQPQRVQRDPPAGPVALFQRPRARDGAAGPPSLLILPGRR